MDNYLFETYQNSAMSHGFHIYETASDMDMAKICAYSSSKHAFPYLKCVLSFCAHLPRIDITGQ